MQKNQTKQDFLCFSFEDFTFSLFLPQKEHFPYNNKKAGMLLPANTQTNEEAYSVGSALLTRSVATFVAAACI